MEQAPKVCATMSAGKLGGGGKLRYTPNISLAPAIVLESTKFD